MSKKQKQGKTRKIFNRITLTIVLGLFLLLLATMALTTAIMPFIAGWWSVSEDNVIVFGVTILAVSIVIGVGFSFAYSAFMLKATRTLPGSIAKNCRLRFFRAYQRQRAVFGVWRGGKFQRNGKQAGKRGNVEGRFCFQLFPRVQNAHCVHFRLCNVAKKPQSVAKGQGGVPQRHH